MIFNLQGTCVAHLVFPLVLPEQSPCRRSPWSRSCPRVAEGWDPVNTLPSSLSSYLLLAFSTLGFNHTSLPKREWERERLPILPRASPRFVRPLSRANPLCLRRSSLRTRNSKEGGPLRTQSAGFAAWKNRLLKDRSPQRHCLLFYLSFARRRDDRDGSRPRDAKIFRWKEPTSVPRNPLF